MRIPRRTPVRAALAGLLITGSVASSLALAGPAQAAGVAPANLALATGGQYTTGVKMQWDWNKSVTRYQLQLDTTDDFDDAALTTVTRASAATAGKQATTVKNLSTATWYYARVRSVTGTSSSDWSRPVRVATAVAWPSPITAVTTRPGPGVGELTVSWTSAGQYTTSYRVDTSLNIFSRTDPTLPREGRNFRSFTVPGNRTSLTLSAAQMADAGAPMGSANHLFVRVYAITEGDAGRNERTFASLRSGDGATATPTGDLPIRVGSYNVRTAGAGDAAPYDWPSRAPYAAKTILSESPGILALQELSPGPMDGRSSSTRQTDSLVAQLAAAGGSRYKLVRRSSYVAPGTEAGSQGTRIIYDTTRYDLLSDCPEITKVEVDGTLVNKGYNAACSFPLPLRDGDSEEFRRFAAYAEFADKATGQHFWVVSAHLDHRTSDDPAVDQSYETLRGTQATAIADTMAALNTEGVPVIVAGDLNTWQNTSNDYAPHNTFVDRGYYDTADAVSKINLAYDTVNKFATTVKPSSSGWGARLDSIFVQGTTGANRFKVVVTPTDPRRGSDHNMVVADFRLPAGS